MAAIPTTRLVHCLAGCAAWLLACSAPQCALSADTSRPVLRVARCADFEVTGRGDNAAWEPAAWSLLSARPGSARSDESRVKMLYSETGLYVLLDGADRTLTASFQEDFATLWTEDVFEFFLWPDEQQPIYLEYEISPLGYELPILVPNLGGEFMGWRPWLYGGDRKIHKAVSITGGEQKSGAAIGRWTAEVFVPYALLKPLRNVPPKPGTQWRGNFYRMDYDGGATSSWDWARVGPSFHEYQKFGSLSFD